MVTSYIDTGALGLVHVTISFFFLNKIVVNMLFQCVSDITSNVWCNSSLTAVYYICTIDRQLAS